MRKIRDFFSIRNNEILRLGVILFIITFTVAFILSIANGATEGKVAELAEKAQQEAMKQVLPSADNFEAINMEDIFGDETEGDSEKDNENNSVGRSEFNIVKEIFIGKSSEDVVGYCVRVAPLGYVGVIDMMVGIDVDKKISGINIISFQETPGLGAKAKDDNFRNQYIGKQTDKPLQVIKSGKVEDDEVIAISGATMTTDAVTIGVNTAMNILTIVKQ